MQNPEVLKTGPRADTISICLAVALGGFQVATWVIAAAIPGISINESSALIGVLQSVKIVADLALAAIPDTRGWTIFSSPSSLNLMDRSLKNSAGTPEGESGSANSLSTSWEAPKGFELSVGNVG